MKLVPTVLSLLLAVPAFAAPDPSAKADKPAPAAAAKTGPGSQVVKQANDKLSAMLKEKPAAGSQEEKDLAAKVTTSVRDLIDIDELGKRAMVDQWAKLTAAQQGEFLATLRALIEDNYIRGLRANLEYTVTYAGEAPDKDGNIVVTTQISTKRHGRPYTIEVDYVLKMQAGKLRAWDVKTDGVGLVENYRIQFNKIVDKDGFPGLIGKMKKKQAATGT
jgi:phospholipid transport system substrate-binding protein